MKTRDNPRSLEPVHAEESQSESRSFGYWLSIYLRVMAAASLCKGIYHWAIVCGIGAPFPSGFDSYPIPFQAATVFFAVIDLVAGVGLWLAAAWGAVLWLTSVISMAMVEVLFPQIFGGNMIVVLIETVLLAVYLGLAFMAAREQDET